MWQPTKIAETFTDMVGKIRVMVEITDGKSTELVMLKCDEPRDAIALVDVGKVCAMKNVPVPKPETIEDLKQIIALKETEITSLKAENISLKAVAVEVKK